MVRDNIELSSKDDYFRIRLPRIKSPRKIKFKGISFKNIRARWKKFRLEILKNKLATQKESLVEMEFSREQLTPGLQKEHVEKKVLKKTRAIAKLESRINFFENGEYLSKEFIDSRAIKLKTMMMKNLIYNRDSLYCVNEQTAEEIMKDNNIYSVSDEETEKIRASVREILEEKKAARKAEAKENNPEPSVVSNDEVAAAIDNEMNKIKISENENSHTKVNKFINEDGTYRLKKEDIDEELRITRFDRSKLPTNETAPTEVIPELDISPFTAVERTKPNVELPRKAITPIAETKGHEFPQIILPTIKEQVENNVVTKTVNEETNEREVPVVVPERKSYVVKPTKVTFKNSEEKPEIYADLGKLMARVSLLKAEIQTIGSMEEEEAKKESSVDARYEEMKRKLSAYADSLEEDCNRLYHSVNETKKNTATKEAQINAMIQMMEAKESVPETTRGRVRR